jgi:serine protease Do
MPLVAKLSQSHVVRNLSIPKAFIGFFCLCILPVSAAAHDEEDLIRAIESTREAVVKIDVFKAASSEPAKGDEQEKVSHSFKQDFSEIFALDENVRNIGSGLILDNSGLIVSSAHLVRDARKIKVTLASGKTTSGTLLGIDKKTDIALLKVSLKQPVTVPGHASLDSVRVGQAVYAIGAPFGFPGSVTAGIISAIRDHSGVFRKAAVIQTDVAVNPGSSGGPLFNHQGEVIGITTEIMSTNGGFQGVSFAVPMDSVLRVVKRLSGKKRDDNSD